MAAYNTFSNQPGPITRAIELLRDPTWNRLQEGGEPRPLYRLLTHMAFPFTRTPGNLMTFGVFDRSPVGFLARKLYREVGAGGARADLALARMRRPVGRPVRQFDPSGVSLMDRSGQRGDGSAGYRKRPPPMAFNVQLCETAYDQLGRDKCLRRVYRAYLRQRTWQLLKEAINGEEIGLACLRNASSSVGSRQAKVRRKSGSTRLFGAALATTTAIVASSASAQPDQTQVPEVGGGAPTPTPPNVSGQPLRNTLDSCMGFWDAGTHMSKTEWRAACRRTLSGTDMGKIDGSARDKAAIGEGRGYRGRAKGSRR